MAISFNGQPYAFGSVLDYNIDTQVSEIIGLDSVLPIELAPERLRVTMGLKIFRSIDNDPSADGILFQKGLRSDLDQEDFLKQPYITIEVRDRQSDQTIMFIPRALVSSRTASVDSEGLMTENWNIIGIGFSGVEGIASNPFKMNG